MRLQKRGAIAKLVMRGKEKLVHIRPTEEDRLLLEVLYYADEVRSPDEIAVRDVALSDTEVQLAQQVIDRVQPTLESRSVLRYVSRVTVGVYRTETQR